MYKVVTEDGCTAVLSDCSTAAGAPDPKVSGQRAEHFTPVTGLINSKAAAADRPAGVSEERHERVLERLRRCHVVLTDLKQLRSPGTGVTSGTEGDL